MENQVHCDNIFHISIWDRCDKLSRITKKINVKVEHYHEKSRRGSESSINQHHSIINNANSSSNDPHCLSSRCRSHNAHGIRMQKLLQKSFKCVGRSLNVTYIAYLFLGLIVFTPLSLTYFKKETLIGAFEELYTYDPIVSLPSYWTGSYYSESFSHINSNKNNSWSQGQDASYQSILTNKPWLRPNRYWIADPPDNDRISSQSPNSHSSGVIKIPIIQSWSGTTNNKGESKQKQHQSASEITAQTFKNIGETNIGNRMKMSSHLEMIKSLVDIEVEVFDSKWSLSDICYKPTIPKMDYLSTQLAHHLIPCSIVTPLDCFWEGSKLHPKPVTNLPLPNGNTIDLRFETLKPAKLINLIQTSGLPFNSEPLINFANSFQINQDGYTTKSCLNPEDSECPNKNSSITNDTLTRGIKDGGCIGMSRVFNKWPLHLIMDYDAISKDHQQGTEPSTYDILALQTTIQLMNPFDLYEYWRYSSKIQTTSISMKFDTNTNIGKNWSPHMAKVILITWQRQFQARIDSIHSKAYQDERGIKENEFKIKNENYNGILAGLTPQTFADQYSTLISDYLKRKRILGLLFCSFVYLFVSTTLTLKIVSESLYVAVVAIFVNSVSIVSGLGILYLMGIAQNPMFEVLPILTFGVGLETIFHIIHKLNLILKNFVFRNYGNSSADEESDRKGIFKTQLLPAWFQLLGPTFVICLSFKLIAISCSLLIPIKAIRTFGYSLLILSLLNQITLLVIFPSLIYLFLTRNKCRFLDKFYNKRKSEFVGKNKCDPTILHHGSSIYYEMQQNLPSHNVPDIVSSCSNDNSDYKSRYKVDNNFIKLSPSCYNLRNGNRDGYYNIYEKGRRFHVSSFGHYLETYYFKLLFTSSHLKSTDIDDNNNKYYGWFRWFKLDQGFTKINLRSNKHPRDTGQSFDASDKPLVLRNFTSRFVLFCGLTILIAFLSIIAIGYYQKHFHAFEYHKDHSASKNYQNLDFRVKLNNDPSYPHRILNWGRFDISMFYPSHSPSITHFEALNLLHFDIEPVFYLLLHKDTSDYNQFTQFSKPKQRALYRLLQDLVDDSSGTIISDFVNSTSSEYFLYSEIFYDTLRTNNEKKNGSYNNEIVDIMDHANNYSADQDHACRSVNFWLCHMRDWLLTIQDDYQRDIMLKNIQLKPTLPLLKSEKSNKNEDHDKMMVWHPNASINGILAGALIEQTRKIFAQNVRDDQKHGLFRPFKATGFLRNGRMKDVKKFGQNLFNARDFQLVNDDGMINPLGFRHYTTAWVSRSESLYGESQPNFEPHINEDEWTFDPYELDFEIPKSRHFLSSTVPFYIKGVNLRNAHGVDSLLKLIGNDKMIDKDANLSPHIRSLFVGLPFSIYQQFISFHLWCFIIVTVLAFFYVMLILFWFGISHLTKVSDSAHVKSHLENVATDLYREKDGIGVSTETVRNYNFGLILSGFTVFHLIYILMSCLVLAATGYFKCYGGKNRLSFPRDNDMPGINYYNILGILLAVAMSSGFFVRFIHAYTTFLGRKQHRLKMVLRTFTSLLFNMAVGYAICVISLKFSSFLVVQKLLCDSLIIGLITTVSLIFILYPIIVCATPLNSMIVLSRESYHFIMPPIDKNTSTVENNYNANSPPATQNNLQFGRNQEMKRLMVDNCRYNTEKVDISRYISKNYGRSKRKGHRNNKYLFSISDNSLSTISEENFSTNSKESITVEPNIYIHIPNMNDIDGKNNTVIINRNTPQKDFIESENVEREFTKKSRLDNINMSPGHHHITKITATATIIIEGNSNTMYTHGKQNINQE
ncbi:unnamed protein product [Gordionus sp. m RMFG-2023]|uniref:uncharacterized protein LOC135931155 isoform X2 n=1 Tax=Gordionus sp. m RMFG-2023 TaxID=3053472 RepID=UPI0030E22FD8